VNRCQLRLAHRDRASRESPARDDPRRYAEGTLTNVHDIRKDEMKNGQSYTGFQLNSTPMIVGAALIGAGSLIGLSGLIVGGSAMVSATRKWFRELEVPPSEVVKHKWGATKAATTAGAGAWQQHHSNGVHTNA
jgi:hypothetical protein